MKVKSTGKSERHFIVRREKGHRLLLVEGSQASPARPSDKNPVRTSQETHYASTTNPNRLMLFGETVAVYCENHTEHTDTLCGQNAEFWCVKAVGA
jgi:hypothetical protein